MLRRQGKLSKRMSCLLGWQIASGLRGDRQQRAANVAGNIKGLLASGETKEVWRCLKGWYKATTNTAPAASQPSLAAQTAKRVDLYRKVPPPGPPHPIHINKADIPDGPPSDGELRDIVRGLRNGCLAEASGLQADHIKVWLSDVMREEEEESDVGLGDKWRIFVRLMQAIC